MPLSRREAEDWGKSQKSRSTVILTGRTCNVGLLKVARKAGVRVSPGPDSYHPHQLEFIELGLAAALKARIPPDRIVNFMDLASLLAWAKKLRERRR